MSSNIIYQDLLDSSYPLAYFAKACGVSHCKDWKASGIPARHLDTLARILKREQRVIGLTGKTPAKPTGKKAIFDIKNNNLSADLSAFLANNREIGDGLQPRGLQALVKFDLDQAESGGGAAADSYTFNVDAVAFAQNTDGKNQYLEYYYLKNIVRKIEGHIKIEKFKDYRKGGSVDKPPKNNSLTPSTCGRHVMAGDLANKIYGDDAPKGAVDILRTVDGGVSYHGLMQCKDPWGCPTCARRLSERRTRGLSLLLNAHVEQYGHHTIGAALFTIPHGLGDDLEDINFRMRKAYSWMGKTAGFKNLRKHHGLRGTSRALEVTYGKNGFHPHYHTLFFFDNDITEDVDFIKLTLFNLWTKALQKFDFSSPDFRAFGFKLVSTEKASLEQIAAYFGKVESDLTEDDVKRFMAKHPEMRNPDGYARWSIEHEMTKWHIKTGVQNWRYSMLDFLRGYAIADILQDEDSKKRFSGLWLQYRRGFKGERQLWTKHKDFKIAELELDDEALMDAPNDKATVLLASIEFEDWVNVIKCQAFAALLRVADKTNGSGVREFLDVLNSLTSLQLQAAECVTKSTQIKAKPPFYNIVLSETLPYPPPKHMIN